jgi:hypothetical protein
MTAKVTKKRMTLLLELERIVGNECYNASIQNWGPNGVFEGEGRDFRYPITFIDEKGGKLKTRYTDDAMPVSTAITGHYAFGANQLQIMRALDKAVTYLENHRGLKL